MKKLNLLLLISLGAFGSTSTLAQNADHFYGGLGVGEATSKIDYNLMTSNLTGVAPSNVSSNQQDASYKIFGGYQFNPYYGIEVGYFNFGAFNFASNSINPARTLNGNVKIEGANLTIVGTLPITDRFSLQGRGGLIDARTTDRFSYTGPGALSNSNPRATQNNYSAGFGFSYKISQSITARAELERFRINDGLGNNANVNLAAISLVFPFGKNADKPVNSVETVAPAPIAPVIIVEQKAPEPKPQLEIVNKEVVQDRLKISFSAEVLFAFDSAKITSLGKRNLDKFAQELKGIKYSNVSIEGNTDRIGTKRYNDKLSLRRAESVKKYLVSINAIEANKIQAIGLGSSKPQTDSNDCKGIKTSPAIIACLQPDRRVDLDTSGSDPSKK